MTEDLDDAVRVVCTACSAVYRTAFARCPRDGAIVKPFETDPLVGSTLEGRYIIEKCIGEGGMGRVYAARHKRLPKNFAIKVLFGDLAANPTTVQRFVREAELASHLEHAACISPVDFGETKTGLLFLVMQLVKGRDLLAIIAEEHRLTETRTMQLGLQILDGLRHAHEKGIVHRDLKLENVMIADDNGRETAKILDFGVARRMTEDGQSDKKLTKSGFIVGTPMYISPEQAMGEKIDGRADLYSLGVILYALLSGQMPYGGEGTDVLMQSMTVPPAPLPDDVVVSAEMEALVFRLLEKDANDRPDSAQNVINLLERVPAASMLSTAQTNLRSDNPGAGQDIVEVAESPSTNEDVDLAQEPARRRGVVLGGAVFLVALLAVGASQFSQSTEPADPPSKKAALDRRVAPPLVERPQDVKPTATSAPPVTEPAVVPKPAPTSQSPAAPVRRAPTKRRPARGNTPKSSTPAASTSPATNSKPTSEPTDSEADPSDNTQVLVKKKPAVPSREDFLALHARVGGLLEKVADNKSTAPISAQYFAVSVPRALGDAAERQKAMTVLASIERRLAP